MARSFAPQNSYFPFHITARCPNREAFHLGTDIIWRIMEDYLYLANKKYDLGVLAFVLMPNHFHLIATSQKFPIGIVMRDFMTETSKEMNRLSGRQNQNWGGRHYKCVLDGHLHLINAYKYVYQNPVRAGLCENVQDWRYSTLHGSVGGSKIVIPLMEDTILFNPLFVDQELQWLNRRIDKIDYEGIRWALSKRTFKLPKIKQKSHHLQNSRA